MRIDCGAITGPYHLRRGEESQDSFKYFVGNDYSVIAVADGAGSLERSKDGSMLAVETVIDECAKLYESKAIDDDFVSHIIERVREKLLSLEDYKQFGCTLSFAIMQEDNYAIGVVGDAFAVVHGEKIEGVNPHILVTTERDSEFANITELLTSKTITPKISSGAGFRAITVSTDGLLHTSIKDNEAVEGFWTPIISKVFDGTLSLDDFLEFMNHKNYIDDDTTLVIASQE